MFKEVGVNTISTSTALLFKEVGVNTISTSTADMLAALQAYNGGEEVLFIGTQFSNLSTAVDTSAVAASHKI